MFKQVASTTWNWNACPKRSSPTGGFKDLCYSNHMESQHEDIARRLAPSPNIVNIELNIVTSILKIEELYLFKSLTIAIHSAFPFPIPAPSPRCYCLINECVYTTLLQINFINDPSFVNLLRIFNVEFRIFSIKWICF